MKKGIDVSEFNGVIDWNKVKTNIDFVMIRAGYGNNHLDKRFNEYSTACEKYNIPYGVYWFSYATTPSEAINEANCVLNLIKTKKITYPVALDYEEDSLAYAKKKGYYPTAETLESIANSFLSTIAKGGYNPIIYSNLSFLNKGFNKVINKYSLWLAQWGVSSPAIACEMWQYSSKGHVNGINSLVDMNYCYKDYGPSAAENTNTVDEDCMKVFEKYIDKYYECAKDVIVGKYGNGKARVKKLKEQSFDPSIVQDLVNILL